MEGVSVTDVTAADQGSPVPSRPTHIVIETLTKRFRRSNEAAVDRVTMDVRRGEFFVLLGPSGSGKTTILKLIAGILSPDSGYIYFDSKVVNEVPLYKRNAPLVFQNYALFPHLTVYQNIAFGLRVRHFPRNEISSRVEETVSLVRLKGLEKKYPAELSGGQQQRVALARAMVVSPEVLLLDEPLSNLDAKLRIELRSELKEIIREAGTTAIYVTHDLVEALHLADRIGIINHGRLVQVGTPKEIFSDPSSIFSAQFVGYKDFLEGEVLKTDGGYVHVKCNQLLIRARTKTETGINENVSVTFRPDDISLSRGGTPTHGLNEFKGQVRQKTFLGENTEYEVSIDGRTLTVRTTDSSIDEGVTVTVTIPPDKCVALSRDQVTREQNEREIESSSISL
jgi:ABC-type Fe3+/spermidine/putrescine transport system ATPase subunit